MLMLMTTAILMSTIFIQLNNPLSMGLLLFIQTILICLMTGMMSKTFWFSYILFLVFLGGMLILFMYIISLASNEMFQFISNSSIIIVLIISLVLYMNKEYMFYNIMNMDMTMNYSDQIANEYMINLNKLYNYPTNLINILLMIYLLITLIVSVKITKINQGPMRKMN